MTRPGEHNGFGAGFDCPNLDCRSIEAFVDFSTDEEGYLNGLLLTCERCGEQWVEAVGAGR